MKLAGRELWLAVGAGVVLALLVTTWLVQSAISDWKAAAQLEKRVTEKLHLTKKLLAKRADVEAQLEVLQHKLPRYGADRDVTAEQMRLLDRIAQEQGFGLGQREPQPEATNGVVHEIMIRSAWESDLSALIHFLYAIQTQDVIFDVRRLTVSPMPSTTDRLKGSMVINSAYAVTEGQVTTNAPAVANEQATTNAVIVTNAPSVTNPAATTNTPAVANEPVTTNAVIVTNAPVVINAPSATNAPAVAATITTNQP